MMLSWFRGSGSGPLATQLRLPRVEFIMTVKLTNLGLALCLSVVTVACSDETAPQRLASDLSLSFQSPASAQIGDSAVFQLAIQNTSTDTVTVVTGCGPALDVVIRDHDGTAVWDPISGQIIATCLAFRGVAPGGELAFQVTWHLRDYSGQLVQPGTFTASASFGVIPADQSNPVTLRAGPARQVVVTQ
jgi:hypothetical protein